MYRVIPASDRTLWRELLSNIGQVDACFLPEYHLAYQTRLKDSEPLLWHFEELGQHFLYPFILTPVVLNTQDSGYYDISSVYGYTGPIATTRSANFIAAAWKAFDEYATTQKLVAEFIRFSPFNNSEHFAHPKTNIEENRKLAVSHREENLEAFLAKLSTKTRNMLRKAERAGLTARELDLTEHLAAFRKLYDETMNRRQALDFFYFDDQYYEKLLLLDQNCLRLFGVFAEDKLVAAAMAVTREKSGLYHLGASLSEYATLGAGNLSLVYMSDCLMKSGVEFINMTGGRTTANDDPLLRFKKSNATGTAAFYIGKRIINPEAYQNLVQEWQKHSTTPADTEKIIFWRSY